MQEVTLSLCSHSLKVRTIIFCMEWLTWSCLDPLSSEELSECWTNNWWEKCSRRTMYLPTTNALQLGDWDIILQCLALIAWLICRAARLCLFPRLALRQSAPPVQPWPQPDLFSALLNQPGGNFQGLMKPDKYHPTIHLFVSPFTLGVDQDATGYIQWDY